MTAKRALIFVNGSLPDRGAAHRLIDPSDVLIAADGGARHVFSCGLVPSILIGDLDSLRDEERQLLESAQTTIIAHPRDKNETDLEAALNHALARRFDPIRIVAALGGRLDQTLGNLALLTDPALSGRDIRLDDGVEEAFFIRKRGELHGKRGEVVSLLPWGEAVTGIRTSGLKWPLRGESLLPHKTRGISNEMLDRKAGVEIESGLLLVVHRRG